MKYLFIFIFLLLRSDVEAKRGVEFTLYPTDSRVDRGNLVLRSFLRHCVLSGGTQRRDFASATEQRNGNINLNKYFI